MAHKVRLLATRPPLCLLPLFPLLVLTLHLFLHRSRPSLKHFTDCKVSALAAMKMLKHALAGVTEGRAERGVPVEIMGLLIGKPDGNAIVVTDVFPLPVKGIEYQVNLLDQAMGFITRAQDALEARRRERFVGWYHSHPFDPEPWSHCHLSATDVATQANWQALAPFWTAIVIDPLRSAQQGSLDMGAYRTYPATHTPPELEAPDGTRAPGLTELRRRWGVSSGRYYALQTSYFSSSAGAPLLQQTAAASLWVTALASTPGRDREALAQAAEGAARARKAVADDVAQMGTKGAVEGDGAKELAKLGACQCAAAAEAVMRVLALSLKSKEDEDGLNGMCDT